MTRKVWKLCVNALTVAFLLIQVYVWGMTQVGVEAYTILSGSMEPALQTGDIVLVNTKKQTAQCEDIIAFYMGGNVIVHRVKEITADGQYITKGDANETADLEQVDNERLIGVVWISLRNFKWLWIFFTSKARYGAIGILIIINLLADEFGNANGGAAVGNT